MKEDLQLGSAGGKRRDQDKVQTMVMCLLGFVSTSVPDYKAGKEASLGQNFKHFIS